MCLHHVSQENRNFASKITSKNSNMSFAGILAGNNIGEVWADDLSNPAFCLVWSEYVEGFHFMGSRYAHTNELELWAFIEDTIIPFLKSKKMEYMEFSCDSPEWIPFICKVFSTREINKWKQFTYTLVQHSNLNISLTLSAGYEAIKIDADFISNKLADMENPEIIRTEIEKAWGSVAKFFECGKGFAAVHGTQICSFATTESVYGDTYGISIKTVGEWQTSVPKSGKNHWKTHEKAPEWRFRFFLGTRLATPKRLTLIGKKVYPVSCQWP